MLYARREKETKRRRDSPFRDSTRRDAGARTAPLSRWKLTSVAASHPARITTAVLTRSIQCILSRIFLSRDADGPRSPGARPVCTRTNSRGTWKATGARRRREGSIPAINVGTDEPLEEGGEKKDLPEQQRATHTTLIDEPRDTGRRDDRPLPSTGPTRLAAMLLRAASSGKESRLAPTRPLAANSNALSESDDFLLRIPVINSIY